MKPSNGLRRPNRFQKAAAGLYAAVTSAAGETPPSPELDDRNHNPGGSNMRLLRYPMTMLLAAATLGSTVAVSHAQSCQDLWVERNSYYKQAGYCFKTARAISYFGNAGCVYDNENAVPLSPYARARINQIVRAERTYGCSN
jgi:hypothetical protein